MAINNLKYHQLSWIILGISTAIVVQTIQVNGLDAYDKDLCGWGNHDAGDFVPAYCNSRDELRTNGSSRHTWNRSSRHNWNRISGGQYASRGDFPSYARVLLYWEGRIVVSCAGTIIHRNLVLSAAHCWSSALKKLQAVGKEISHTEVMVGDVNELNGNWQRIRVKKVCLNPFHVKYAVQDVLDRIGYDSAILKLERDIEYNRFAKPACLETGYAHREQATCYAVGMGRIGEGGLKDGRLKYVPLKRNCFEGPLGEYYRREESKSYASTCYKPVGRGTSCIGDSGGPMICMDDCRGSGPRQFIAGPISFGHSFDQNGKPMRAKCVRYDNLIANYIADVSKLAEDDGWSNMLGCVGD